MLDLSEQFSILSQAKRPNHWAFTLIIISEGTHSTGPLTAPLLLLTTAHLKQQPEPSIVMPQRRKTQAIWIKIPLLPHFHKVTLTRIQNLIWSDLIYVPFPQRTLDCKINYV